MSNIFFSFLIFFTYSIIIFEAVLRNSEFLKNIFLQPYFQEKKSFLLQFYKLRKSLESKASWRYHDYFLLVMQVYYRNYGIADFLSLYQNLQNFQTPVQGVKYFFRQKQKYFLNQCISVNIFWGVLYYICEIYHISPPLYIYMENVKKKHICSQKIFEIFYLVIIGTPMNIFQKVLVAYQFFTKKSLIYIAIYEEKR